MLIVPFLTLGCSNDNNPPEMLFDGSSPPSLAVELEGSDEAAVLTRIEFVELDSVAEGSSVHACIRAFEGDVQPGSPLTRRVGVDTETVTFRSAAGNGLAGCDNSLGPRVEDRRWCGLAFGRLYSGRLRDPRTTVGCATEAGDQIGFAWVHPQSDTRYLAVDQPGYAEVYEIADELPVRVSATNAVNGSRTHFKVSEHDADGRLVRRYELDAAVAG